MLPSLAQISRSVEGLFVIEDLHNLGPHYDKTLMAWPRLAGRYDARFKSMWDYYLLTFAGTFRARSIQLWQLVLTRYGTPQPSRRF
ncbi:MAG: class I SAM-dependent methyltransferase [Desulfobacterales bacterium]|nr:class I SAM-dependent methyltransferase [Desulfobacterales bacterium]